MRKLGLGLGLEGVGCDLRLGELRDETDVADGILNLCQRISSRFDASNQGGIRRLRRGVRALGGGCSRWLRL